MSKRRQTKIYYTVDYGVVHGPFMSAFGFRTIWSTEIFENKQEALVRAKEIFKENKDCSGIIYVSVSSFDYKTEQIITEDILLLSNKEVKEV